MAKLNSAHKEQIIKSLACYLAPTDIVTLFKNEYGLHLTYNQVAFYNPGTLASAGLSDKWRVLFHTTRDKYLSDVKAVPIAYKAYRLNILQKCLDKAMIDNDINLTLEILEQASKEMKVIEELNMNDSSINRKKNIFEYLEEINQRILDSGVLDD